MLGLWVWLSSDPAPHGFWERLVRIRAAMLHVLEPMGWVILAVICMIVLLRLMRAAGRADHPEL